jgi:regulator of sigma E protease
MLTLLAFVLALGVLIAIHEYGHYRVAVACGIKVLKFSIGFGKPIYSWRLKGKATEFSIGMLPLGGYVKMLDEREAPVEAAERHLAFNTQPLRSRAAVVVAGPVANLLFAIALYSLLNWTGLQEPKAVLASPIAGSVAEKAGLRGQELVRDIGFDGEALESVRSFEDLRWKLMQAALSSRNLRLTVSKNVQGDVTPDASVATREVLLVFQNFDAAEVDAQFFRRIGIAGPWTAPVIGMVVQDGPAAKAGLKAGDIVVRVGKTDIVDGQQLRQVIRASNGGVSDGANSGATGDTAASQTTWTIIRNSKTLDLLVSPRTGTEGKLSVAKIDASVGSAPEFLKVRYGLFDGAWRGLVHTYESSLLTLKMMGKMLTGQASLKNLSGPLTIADYAGKSASIGLTAYLLFMAAISVSLGVLNLLPLPVLDGGHLMYYLWELVMGKSLSQAWMEGLQRGGIAVLLCMMSIALYNDVARIFG